MTPGPELDRLVAEKVMGWRYEPEFGLMDGERFLEIDGAWTPSTNIAHAWEVVERMRDYGKIGACLEMEEDPNDHDGRWLASYFVRGDKVYHADADTAPHAICLAALKAYGISVDAPTPA